MVISIVPAVRPSKSGVLPKSTLKAMLPDAPLATSVASVDAVSVALSSHTRLTSVLEAEWQTAVIM